MTVANPAWNSHSASLFTAELATTEDNYSIKLVIAIALTVGSNVIEWVATIAEYEAPTIAAES